jgi:NAD(P)-dependent dehydrogenase (short-subunit alcohol dehydrogenase family)
MTRFGAQSTTDEVLEGIDLSGKRALVTGVSAGLGVETARALTAHGAEVVGAARDLAKAEAATAHVREAAGGRFSLAELDLASLGSVRACADRLLADGRPFDLVIANAGVMATPLWRTAEGFEGQLGTNHLGHFVLVNRIAALMPPGARLVNLASVGHQFADIDLDDVNFERRAYDPIVAYGGSKTANVLFTVEFDRRHKARGVRAAAVHPGGIMTELARSMTSELVQQMIQTVAAEAGPAAAGGEHSFKTVPQGAATTLWAAVRAPAEEVGGRYCEDCHAAEVRARGSGRGGVRAYALDPERAKRLWAISEQLVQEAFPP